MCMALCKDPCFVSFYPYRPMTVSIPISQMWKLGPELIKIIQQVVDNDSNMSFCKSRG